MLNTQNIIPYILKHTETVVDAKATAKSYRHFGINPDTSYQNVDGPEVTVRFISTLKPENGFLLPLSVLQDQLTTSIRLSYPKGAVLKSKEKSALYPVIQFNFEPCTDSDTEETSVIQGYKLKTCHYKEVRKMDLDDDYISLPRSTCYIVLGFKTADSRFDQVLVESWKDWTNARYIYVNMPEELGLKKISLLYKTSTDLDSFTYLVIVECRSVDSKSKQMMLLDFAQRLRVERPSDFISVYDLMIF